jgi:hypothetical protein
VIGQPVLKSGILLVVSHNKAWGRTVERRNRQCAATSHREGEGFCCCTECVQKWPPTSSSGYTAAGDTSAFSWCQSARISSWHTMAFAPKRLASLGLKFNCKTRLRSNCSGSNNMSLKMKRYIACPVNWAQQDDMADAFRGSALPCRGSATTQVQTVKHHILFLCALQVTLRAFRTVVLGPKAIGGRFRDTLLAKTGLSPVSTPLEIPISYLSQALLFRCCFFVSHTHTHTQTLAQHSKR